MRNRIFRSLLCAAAVAAAAFAATAAPATRSTASDPFHFFHPWIRISDVDRHRLDRDEVVVRMLSGGDRQLAMFVATRLNAPPDALVLWTRAIAELRRSRFVLATGRFSEPPTAADLEALTLDEQDLQSFRDCAVNDCGLKLSAPEIGTLNRVVASGSPGWREDARREFFRLILARVSAYQTAGLPALPPIVDRETPRPLDQAFASIVAKSPYLLRIPTMNAWLREYPAARDSHIESFFYWSKEYYGTGKPVISVTQVGIARPEPNGRLPVLVAGKQIFSTHYVDGSLGLTLVMRDPSSGHSYLVYVNRSELDLLRGFLGGFARTVLETRLKRQAPQVIQGLRTRLEGAGPADAIGRVSASSPLNGVPDSSRHR